MSWGSRVTEGQPDLSGQVAQRDWLGAVDSQGEGAGPAAVVLTHHQHRRVIRLRYCDIAIR
eukprot:596091-Prorocentrum_minimum.AAC.2